MTPISSTVGSAPLHQTAGQALQMLWNAGDDLWVSRQVLREYAMVVTRPQSFMQPLTPSMTATQVQAFIGQFQIADDTSTVTAQWLTLLQTLTIAGRQVYDANIVATMLAFGITHLLTNNPTDFTRYGQRITVIPL